MSSHELETWSEVSTVSPIATGTQWCSAVVQLKLSGSEIGTPAAVGAGFPFWSGTSFRCEVPLSGLYGLCGHELALLGALDRVVVVVAGELTAGCLTLGRVVVGVGALRDGEH